MTSLGRIASWVGGLTVGLGIGMAAPAVAMADSDSDDGGSRASAEKSDAASGTAGSVNSASASANASAGAGSPTTPGSSDDASGARAVERRAATTSASAAADDRDRPAKRPTSSGPDSADAMRNGAVTKKTPVSPSASMAAGDALDGKPSAPDAPAGATQLTSLPWVAQRRSEASNASKQIAAPTTTATTQLADQSEPANALTQAGADESVAAHSVPQPESPAAQSSKTVTVTTDDADIEPTETLALALSSASDITTTNGSAVGAIAKSDPSVAQPAAAVWGDAFFAPYADMGAYPVPNLLEIAHATGASLLTLGFIQADPEGNPAWGALSVLALDSTQGQALAIKKSIADLKAAGGDVMISFGGASNVPLWQSYHDRGLNAQELADTYARVADFYGVTRIDFDIEGAAVADKSAIALNSEAIALLQEDRPDLKVWYTLPVLPDGLTRDGLDVVEAALKAGVTPAGVNVMAMDFGDTSAPTSGPNAKSMGAYAVQSGESTHTQLSELYARYGKTFTYQQWGSRRWSATTMS